MTCQTIYSLAMSLANPVDDSGDPVDCSAIALPVLNGFAAELCSLADLYCRQNGIMDGRFLFIEVGALTDPFPLPERFASAATFYLASMIAMGKAGGTALSTALYERYRDAISSVRSELQAKIESILNVYGTV